MVSLLEEGFNLGGGGLASGGRRCSKRAAMLVEDGVACGGRRCLRRTVFLEEELKLQEEDVAQREQ